MPQKKKEILEAYEIIQTGKIEKIGSQKKLIQFGKIRSCDAIEILRLLQKQNINIPLYNS